MSLKFENNQVKEFDVTRTFGKLFYLSTQPIFENDADGARTDSIREQRVTLYSEAKNDQIELALPAAFDPTGLVYDEEVTLTGDVTALAWLSTYTGYNDSLQSEQAFKIRAEGLKKVVSPAVKTTDKPNKSA